jgi:hypothetical protein
VIDTAKIEAAVRMLLEGIGEDPEREGLKDTPAISAPIISVDSLTCSIFLFWVYFMLVPPLLFKGRALWQTPRMLAGGTSFFKQHFYSLQECSLNFNSYYNSLILPNSCTHLIYTMFMRIPFIDRRSQLPSSTIPS